MQKLNSSNVYYTKLRCGTLRNGSSGCRLHQAFGIKYGMYATVIVDLCKETVVHKVVHVIFVELEKEKQRCQSAMLASSSAR